MAVALAKLQLPRHIAAARQKGMGRDEHLEVEPFSFVVLNVHYNTSHCISLHYYKLLYTTIHHRITVPCITLHYLTTLMTLYCLKLSDAILPYMSLLYRIILYIQVQCSTVHYSTLQQSTLHYTTLQDMTWHDIIQASMTYANASVLLFIDACIHKYTHHARQRACMHSCFLRQANP